MSKYSWDSTVPNHAKVSEGDTVVVRDQEQPIGIARIAQIDVSIGAEKSRYRCPKCRTTKIRARKSVVPTYRCGECKTEFDSPEHENVLVTGYAAQLCDFRLLAGKIRLPELRSCLLRPGSQHAMSEADPALFEALLGRAHIEPMQ
jgi:DNA-directed RNA polymerase subunit RPC12/RpoP